MYSPANGHALVQSNFSHLHIQKKQREESSPFGTPELSSLSFGLTVSS
jgi:hypothetical protein